MSKRRIFPVFRGFQRGPMVLGLSPYYLLQTHCQKRGMPHLGKKHLLSDALFHPQTLQRALKGLDIATQAQMKTFWATNFDVVIAKIKALQTAIQGVSRKTKTNKIKNVYVYKNRCFLRLLEHH